jgi:FtsZ-binding cell division protein ZapB
MPGELRDKLKLLETLNKILKNNGVVDIDVLEGVVNELKAKLNTLINDVLGVEHSNDNIHNYNHTNMKENLKEITDQVNNVHTDINNTTSKLSIQERIGNDVSNLATLGDLSSLEDSLKQYTDEAVDTIDLSDYASVIMQQKTKCITKKIQRYKNKM